jgi:hypothetical protein
MSKMWIVLLFVAGAALSWGLYVPSVHVAATTAKSSLRAFLLVGLAYFIVAVMIPAIMIYVAKFDPTIKGDPNFNGLTIRWGLAAGTFGAVGALCVIFAATAAGKGGVIYVAPLVFAGAPIINTIATITYFHRVEKSPDWRFFMGLGLAAAGAAMVLIYKPVDDPKPGDGHEVAPSAATSASH